MANLDVVVQYSIFCHKTLAKTKIFRIFVPDFESKLKSIGKHIEWSGIHDR